VPNDLAALVNAVDAPDRDTSRQLPITLLQHNSVDKLTTRKSPSDCE
jgi:hypothetical protein